MKKRITFLLLVLLSWLAIPTNAQTYFLKTGTRVAIDDLVVGHKYVIFSTAARSSNPSGLAYSGYIYDSGSSFSMNQDGNLPGSHTPTAAEIWTLVEKSGNTVKLRNVSTGRYITSDKDNPLSASGATVDFYDYASLPDPIVENGSDVASVSDDGQSSITCNGASTNSNFEGKNVVGICSTNRDNGGLVRNGSSVMYSTTAGWGKFSYPFAIYEAEEEGIVTFVYVKDGVTYYTVNQSTGLSAGDTYTFLVPNAYKGYAITSATNGTTTVSTGENLSFTLAAQNNVVTVNLGTQNDIRDFKEVKYDYNLTEITDINDIFVGKVIVMQINRGGDWGYMYWQSQDNKIGRESDLRAKPENVFVITKAVANQDGTKTVQIMGKDGYFFPTLSGNGVITMSTTPADYTLSRNSDDRFHLKNGNKGVDNDGNGNGTIAAWSYGETSANQQIRIYSVSAETFNSLTISSIPVDVLGNNVTNGGKYAIRMPEHANGSSVTPNRYLTGTSGSNYIVQKEIPFDASMVWTLSYAPEGLKLKSDNNGNYAAILNNYLDGHDKEFLTAATADDAEVWFPTTQTVEKIISGDTCRYKYYALKTTSGNKVSNYLSNHGGAGTANMGFYNSATDNGSLFQFVPVYNVNFVDESGTGLSTTLNGFNAADGAFVMPHRDYYTFSNVIFPTRSDITTMDQLLFDINGTEWDFQGLCDALAKVTEDLTITVKSTTSMAAYTATTGTLTRINDKNDNKVVSGDYYFLKMRQDATKTTDAEIDANVAYQTNAGSGNITQLAWNGSPTQVWQPFGTLKTVVLKNNDGNYLKVTGHPSSGIEYGTSVFSVDANVANATPFAAWPCDAVLLRYYLTTTEPDGTTYQYTSDQPNNATYAGLNTEVVTTDNAGVKMQFVPANKLTFIVYDANGDEMPGATITYNGVTFNNSTMRDVYVEKFKGLTTLTINDGSETRSYDEQGYYNFTIGDHLVKAANLSNAISTLTGNATIKIQVKPTTGYEVPNLLDVNGDLVQSNQIYRIHFTARDNSSATPNSQQYYLTQVHNSTETMASNAIIGNGKQHWYPVYNSTTGKIQLKAVYGTGYIGYKGDATGNAPSEAIVGGKAITSIDSLVAGKSFALRWNTGDYYFDGENASTATVSDYFTLVTAPNDRFYLMRTSTANTTPSYIKAPTTTWQDSQLYETTVIAEAAQIEIVQATTDSTFYLKTWVDPSNDATATYFDKKAGNGNVPTYWLYTNADNTPIKFYEPVLDFAYTEVDNDNHIYTLSCNVNGTDTYLGNPNGTGYHIGFSTAGGTDCNVCFIPVGLALGTFGREITAGNYRIELPGRMTTSSPFPVTLTMNGGAGNYGLSDREQYYVNPQSITDYRQYYWLSESDENVKYRYDSTQVWTLEFNGIAGVWIKNIKGQYLRAERLDTTCAGLITDTVSNREKATLWALRPVTVSGMNYTYNLIAANDTIATPTNWYLSNFGGGHSNMGFYNRAKDGGSYFTFTPVNRISRADAYAQGLINGYGFTCYGLGYKSTPFNASTNPDGYSPGDNRDSIQGYMLPEQLWLPYNSMSNSFSFITFHQPELIGYNYNKGITLAATTQSDKVIRYTGYELNEFPIISSKAPHQESGEWVFDEDTHWYAITIRARDHAADPPVMRQDFYRYDHLSDINTPFCDKYLWCFVGDSIHGYLVYNKAEGAGRYMGSTNPDHICTPGMRNITWLPNDNSPEVKSYSKHLFQVTQHTQSGYYMLMDRYSNLSFDGWNNYSNYWHARDRANGNYLQNVLHSSEWTNGQTFKEASYENSIYPSNSQFYARTMTFPYMTDIYKQTFTPAYFNGYVGYVGMHVNTDSVTLNMNRLYANLESIGTVDPADYASTSAYKTALEKARADSLAAYDHFLDNLYLNGVKYDQTKAYRLINEKTARWLSANANNGLTDVANFSEGTNPGTLWKFIPVGDKAIADNSSMNNKYYKLHNIYRSANLVINNGSVSLVPEAYENRSSEAYNSGIGTNIDFLNDMVYMDHWGEFVIKTEGQSMTGSGTGTLLTSSDNDTFSAGYETGSSDLGSRWLLKGFDIDSVSLAMPTSGDPDASLVYTSYIDPDNDYTWPYNHGLSAWRMTWRHDAVIRGQKITPTTDTDRPFIPAGTGVLFRGPKDVKFPVLPCDASGSTINSLLVSPDGTAEVDTIAGVPGYKMAANSGYVIDYVNNESVVRCCLLGSENYTSSNYTALDGGYVFLPKNKPYIPNDVDHYGSQDFTLILELEDEFGNVTRIGTIDANGNINLNDDNAFYDMQGRRVTHPVKGQIYIQNGKKIYFK